MCGAEARFVIFCAASNCRLRVRPDARRMLKQHAPPEINPVLLQDFKPLANLRESMGSMSRRAPTDSSCTGNSGLRKTQTPPRLWSA
jgi:hypothetical protein